MFQISDFSSSPICADDGALIGSVGAALMIGALIIRVACQDCQLLALLSL